MSISRIACTSFVTYSVGYERKRKKFSGRCVCNLGTPSLSVNYETDDWIIGIDLFFVISFLLLVSKRKSPEANHV